MLSADSEGQFFVYMLRTGNNITGVEHDSVLTRARSDARLLYVIVKECGTNINTGAFYPLTF
jgi:hypothetical protein